MNNGAKYPLNSGAFVGRVSKTYNLLILLTLIHH